MLKSWHQVTGLSKKYRSAICHVKCKRPKSNLVHSTSESSKVEKSSGFITMDRFSCPLITFRRTIRFWQTASKPRFSANSTKMINWLCKTSWIGAKSRLKTWQRLASSSATLRWECFWKRMESLQSLLLLKRSRLTKLLRPTTLESIWFRKQALSRWRVAEVVFLRSPK